MYTDKEIHNFFSNVKRLRIKNRLTKKQMAEICGIGVGSLDKIENGILPPRLGTKVLINIHKHFCVMTSQLFEELTEP